MTALSVNINKLALLRNSRGRNFPDLLHFSQRFLALGVHGITVHPRPDERHIKFRDVPALAELVNDHKGAEFNIEGYPSDHFIQMVRETRPHQCTLVPDADNQLTSDHGWDLHQHGDFLRDLIPRFKDKGIRVAVFLDPRPELAELVARIGADRIELYTEAYAEAFATQEQQSITEQYRLTALAAQRLGVGVNAGHDLDLLNLPGFLQIPDILEVSIGHALTVECIEQGMETVIHKYLEICAGH